MINSKRSVTINKNGEMFDFLVKGDGEFMQMTFRWFGSEKDTVTLAQIRQIPGVTGVVPALHYLPAGEVWPMEDILKMKGCYLCIFVLFVKRVLKMKSK